jgi:hypothetical protein
MASNTPVIVGLREVGSQRQCPVEVLESPLQIAADTVAHTAVVELLRAARFSTFGKTKVYDRAAHGSAHEGVPAEGSDLP